MNRRELTLDELALAYELKQEGCCWKRISVGLGCDHRYLQQAVNGLTRRGIRKGTDGYARQPGRPAVYPIVVLRAAHGMRQRGRTWPEITKELGGYPGPMRQAHRHALAKGLIV